VADQDERFVRPLLTRRRFLIGAGVAAAAAMTAPAVVSAQRPHQEFLGRWFDQRFGAWVAGDVPHAYDLGGGRTLWVTNDSYLSNDPAVEHVADATFVRNAAFTERLGRLGLVHDPTSAFLPHDGNHFDQWWWFHGGMRVDDRLRVFVSRMRRTGALGWAINFEYAETWLATFSALTGSLVDLRPAPDASTRPMYGFSVASDDWWTYLFGNNVMYGDGTTETRVARVPRGELDRAPSYWNGSRWVADRNAARAVHVGGSYANRLHVLYHDGRWLATCKYDEFFGSEIHVLEAPGPTGPWRVVLRRSIPTVTGDDRTCTYDAMARFRPDGRLHLWWSNNAYAEADVRADPSCYRPSSALVTV
jgi:hypothetical protein